MSDECVDLRQYSISYLLNYGVDEETLQPWFEFSALKNLLTLRITGLVYMSFSRPLIFPDSFDAIVLEVDCQRKLISPDDLLGYGYILEPTEHLPELVVLYFHGVNLKIICESFDVRLEPLSHKYPWLR